MFCGDGPVLSLASRASFVGACFAGRLLDHRLRFCQGVRIACVFCVFCDCVCLRVCVRACMDAAGRCLWRPGHIHRCVCVCMGLFVGPTTKKKTPMVGDGSLPCPEADFLFKWLQFLVNLTKNLKKAPKTSFS